jgi:hypothetical protein
MCTVTIVPHAGGVRLVCNRDERLARLPALPPQVQRVGGRVAAFPVDPVGGGTWIGVNDARVIVTLLNRTVAARGTGSARRPRSRGEIVRSLLADATVAAVMARAAVVDAWEYEPFELVVTDGTEVGIVSSDGVGLRLALSPLESPQLFTSSGLGDALVEAPRRALFERMVVRAPGSALEGQRRFHRHRWRRRPHVSVCMSRIDAATVSRTCVDVTPRGWRLIYDALDGASACRVTSSPSP